MTGLSAHVSGPKWLYNNHWLPTNMAAPRTRPACTTFKRRLIVCLGLDSIVLQGGGVLAVPLLVWVRSDVQSAPMSVTWLLCTKCHATPSQNWTTYIQIRCNDYTAESHFLGFANTWGTSTAFFLQRRFDFITYKRLAPTQ